MSRIVMCQLPTDVRGFVKEDVDGEVIIFLNSRLTQEANMKTLLHEQGHIKDDDLGECNVDEIEYLKHVKKG